MTARLLEALHRPQRSDPAGSRLEFGLGQIRRSEQADEDLAEWRIRSRHLDTLQLAEQWIERGRALDSGSLAQRAAMQAEDTRPRITGR